MAGADEIHIWQNRRWVYLEIVPVEQDSEYSACVATGGTSRGYKCAHQHYGDFMLLSKRRVRLRVDRLAILLCRTRRARNAWRKHSKLAIEGFIF